MTLTLELTDATGVRPPDASHVFGEEGGTIGRAATNAWVLPHNKVSGLHARITFRNGAFYIEDTSRNGVSVNSPDNRLVRNRPYPLKSGDRLFIEPYEMTIWIDDVAGARLPAADPFADEDPFRLTPAAAPPLRAGEILPEAPDAAEVDPLKFFDPVGAPPPRKRAELPVDDPGGLGQHYQPPAILPAPGAPPPPPSALAGPAIPAGYNPLADDPVEPFAPPMTPAGPVRPRPGDSAAWRRKRDGATPDPQRPSSGRAPAPPPLSRREPIVRAAPPPPPPPPAADPFSAASEPAIPGEAAVPPAMPRPDPARSDPERTRPPIAPPPVVAPAAPAVAAPAVASPPPLVTPRVPQPQPAAPASDAGVSTSDAPGTSDLADLLAGAGIPGAVVTPELTRNLGQILRVVVEGLMDVLQSRQRIKEEFRMQQTVFRQADNNPLKFSANVEDALHNLLVKRNAAYLRPVEAFGDAFDDLRDHQLAMLAGMRVAFDAMLAEFDPDRLQKDFDGQLGKSSLALVPAKLRYWDLFRARRAEITKDSEAAFERLFGEQFRRAYEEQFRQLKAQRRSSERS